MASAIEKEYPATGRRARTKINRSSDENLKPVPAGTGFHLDSEAGVLGKEPVPDDSQTGKKKNVPIKRRRLPAPRCFQAATDSPVKKAPKPFVRRCFHPRCEATQLNSPKLTFVALPKYEKRIEIGKRVSKALGEPFYFKSMTSATYCCADHYTPHDFQFFSAEERSGVPKKCIMPSKLLKVETASSSTWVDHESTDAEMLCVLRQLVLQDRAEQNGSDQYERHNVKKSAKAKLFHSPERNNDFEVIESDEDEPEKEEDQEYDRHDPDYYPSTEPSSDSESEEQESTDSMSKEDRRADTVQLCLMHSRRFLGVDKCNLKVIDLLAKRLSSKTARVDIIMTLRKVRKNESYADLAIYFAWSPKTISSKIRETLPVIAASMRALIFRPSPETIVKNLPEAFRYRYSGTSEIIDCFETQIQKSTNAYLQNLTYSSYKHTNTLKVLVSMTPDGLVCFVSDSFCGRISDLRICEVSGYIDGLSEGMEVEADRGFKHLEPKLKKKKCKLVRPPSVSEGQVLSREVSAEAKKIASLRIHVERLIQRLRDFQVLSPHSSISKDFIPFFDDAVCVACGLVNLMGPLIKV